MQFECDKTASVETHHLAGFKLAFHDHATGVYEGESIPFELLKDEAFAAEQPRSDLPLKGDPDRHSLSRAQKGLLLAQDGPALLIEIQRNDAARIGRGEGDTLPGTTRIPEHGHGQRLSRENTFSG